MVAGLLLGLVSVSIFGLTISLSSAGGLLLAGIVIGTVRAINPALGGPVPESARQILEDLGLNLFMVMLGLTAGPNLAGALGGKTLVPLLVSGAIVTLLPGFLGWLAGLFFYRMNVAVLMGTVAGARGSTIAMRTAQEESQSIVPAIGYPVPYALSRVLVATWGLVTITLS
jgi:putative transport protein